jgi:glutamate--cysteine ligase
MIRIKNATYIASLINSFVGLEVETHRINTDGGLSTHPYPSGLLDEKKHHFIKNDFLETQSELITPPEENTHRGLTYLGAYHQALRSELASSEYLWPYSMPPKLRSDHADIEIAQTDHDNYVYRQKVAQIRKIERTAETGVHVNIGLTPAAIHQIGIPPTQDEIDNLYLQAAIGFMNYRWLLTYLFGATPFAFDNYFSKTANMPAQAVRSLRNSHFGFGNGFLASYRSVSEYVTDIEDAVRDHEIIAEREYYGTVRLKRTPHLKDLLADGILYTELRIYDLDPFEPMGISEDAVNIIRLMFAYFAGNQPFNLDESDHEISAAVKKNDTVALENPLTVTQFHDQAVSFIEKLSAFSQMISLPFNAEELCLRMLERIDNPLLTPSARLVTWSNNDAQQLFDKLLLMAKGYQNDFLDHPLYGYEDRSLKEQKRKIQQLKMGKQLVLKNN